MNTVLRFPKLSITETAAILAAAATATGIQAIAPTALTVALRVVAAAPQAISAAVAYLKPLALAAWTPAAFALPIYAAAFAAKSVVDFANLTGKKFELSKAVNSWIKWGVSNAAMVATFYALSAPTLALAVAATVWNVKVVMLTASMTVQEQKQLTSPRGPQNQSLNELTGTSSSV